MVRQAAGLTSSVQQPRGEHICDDKLAIRGLKETLAEAFELGQRSEYMKWYDAPSLYPHAQTCQP